MLSSLGEIIIYFLALMTGLLSLIREGFAIFNPELSNSRKKRIFYVTIRIAFAASLIVLWFNERAKLNESNQKISQLEENAKQALESKEYPQISASVQYVYLTKEPKTDYLQAAVFITIDNFGAPTTIDNYRASLKLTSKILNEDPSFSITMANPLYYQKGLQLKADNWTQRYTKDNELSEKTGVKTIETNGRVRGYLLFEIRSNIILSLDTDTLKKVLDTAVLTIQFTDNRKKNWETSYTIPRVPLTGPPPIFLPGVENDLQVTKPKSQKPTAVANSKTK